jgi:hypothetical protein
VLLLCGVVVLVLVLVVLIYLYGRWICLFSGKAHKHSIVAVQPEELTTNAGRSVRLLKLPEGEDWYGLGFRILFERDFYEVKPRQIRPTQLLNHQKTNSRNDKKWQIKS